MVHLIELQCGTRVRPIFSSFGQHATVLTLDGVTRSKAITRQSYSTDKVKRTALPTQIK